MISQTAERDPSPGDSDSELTNLKYRSASLRVPSLLFPTAGERPAASLSRSVPPRTVRREIASKHPDDLTFYNALRPVYLAAIPYRFSLS